VKREERYKLTKERNESGMVCEKIIDTKPPVAPRKGLLAGKKKSVDSLLNKKLPTLKRK